MDKNKRSNWNDFKEILDQHHIARLYHFTDRDNLESIIKKRRSLFLGRLRREGHQDTQAGRRRHLAKSRQEGRLAALCSI